MESETETETEMELETEEDTGSNGNGNGNKNNINNFGTMWESFLRSQHDSLKSLFQRRNKPSSALPLPPHHSSLKPIPQLSPLANSVVSRSSQYALFSSLPFPIQNARRFTSFFGRILGVSTQELQHAFDSELPVSVKELLTYARNLLEFCSYKALHKLGTTPDYLNDKEFRRLTYDMMLAWEAPSIESDNVSFTQKTHLILCSEL